MSEQHHTEPHKNAHARIENLSGGVAIVTGGASGIGYALVEAAVTRGMHGVIADIETEAIQVAEDNLSAAAHAAGVKLLGCTVDVSSQESVAGLADTVTRAFPDTPISLLCCNAGVGGGGGVLTARDIDWDFVIGVNVKGVANCVRTFVPKMLSQNAPGAIVTTSSQDGICCAQGVYGVTKHACVALTEALYNEVRGALSVHVLCPNAVATNIVTSERNRPVRYGGITKEARPSDTKANPIAERFKAFGMAPSRCANLVFDAIQSGEFYILAEAIDDPGYVHLEAQTRMDAILNKGLPSRPKSELLTKVFDLRIPLPDKE